MVASEPTWFPAEVIQVGGREPETAYVLGEDSGTVSILWRDGKTDQVSADDVSKRIACRLTTPSLISVFAVDDRVHVPPKCVD